MINQATNENNQIELENARVASQLFHTILENVNLLSEWNKGSINVDPEQVRKNLETMVGAFKMVHDALYY